MRTALERFEEKYIPEPMSGCWLWIAASFPHGYGKFGVARGRTEYAHRASWQMYVGDIPDSAYILHRCDNRCCVNPDHLFLGTHASNMADMMHKGREAKGERVGGVKLTDADVRAIRSDDRSLSAIAEDYGVTFQNVSQIKARKTWAWVI